jgi:hypothetical protein
MDDAKFLVAEGCEQIANSSPSIYVVVMKESNSKASFKTCPTSRAVDLAHAFFLTLALGSPNH